MQIATKQAYTAFVNTFLLVLLERHQVTIKSSKAREMLAKAGGFKSHNGLINNFPIDSSIWLARDSVAYLDEHIKTVHGWSVSSLAVLQETITYAQEFSFTERDDASTHTVHDYAYIREDKFDGKYVMCLTPLGREVYDAAADILGSLDDRDASWPEVLFEAEDNLFTLIERHPENPWLKAMFVITLSNYSFQSGWTENLRPKGGREGFVADCDQRYEQKSYDNAQYFCGMAEDGISQFLIFLGDKIDKVCDHRLSSENAEPFSYPALLYYGGKVHLNRNQYDKAFYALSLNNKVVEGDEFGARYYLAALSLILGKESISTYFDRTGDDYVTGGWGDLCFAIEAYKRGNIATAKDYFLSSMKENFGTFEVFGSLLSNRNEIRIITNYSAPAAIQELHFILKPFWKSNPDALKFFNGLAKSPKLKAAISNYHAAKTGTFGTANMPRDQVKKVREALSEATLELERVYAATVN